MITETLPDTVEQLRQIVAWQHGRMRDLYDVLAERGDLSRAIDILETPAPECVTLGDEVLQLKLCVP